MDRGLAGQISSGFRNAAQQIDWKKPLVRKATMAAFAVGGSLALAAAWKKAGTAMANGEVRRRQREANRRVQKAQRSLDKGKGEGKKCGESYINKNYQCSDDDDVTASGALGQDTHEGLYPVGTRDRFTKDNAVISINTRISNNSVSDALDSLDTIGASERASDLREFINNKKIQMVFRDNQEPVEMRDTFTSAIQKNIDVGVSWDPPIVEHFEGSTGYAAISDNHIVVIADGSSGKQFKVNPTEVRKSVLKGLAGGYSLYEHANGDDKAFIATLHTLGHMINKENKFEARPRGTKAGPQSSKINDREWFANNYVAWMVDRDAYRQYDRKGAEFVERVHQAAVQSSRLTAKKKNG